MRGVLRGPKPAPASLSARNRDGVTELERVRAHLNAPLAPGVKRKAFKFAAYKADDVKARLEELFHGKCAYCESIYASQQPVDVEHFRPKGSVEGAEGHGGYWWIAMQWDNLLPSCIDCNRRRRQGTPKIISDLRVLYQTMSTGKEDAFPVAGTRAVAETTDFSGERALLLDPTRDDPQTHIAFDVTDGISAGLVFPKPVGGEQPSELPTLEADHQVIAAIAEAANLSVRGAVSIQVYGLNRVRLVQERASVLRRLRFLETLLTDLGRIAASIDKAEITDDHPEVKSAVRSLRLLQGQILAEMKAMAASDAPYSSLVASYLAELHRRVTVAPP